MYVSCSCQYSVYGAHSRHVCEYTRTLAGAFKTISCVVAITVHLVSSVPCCISRYSVTYSLICSSQFPTSVAELYVRFVPFVCVYSCGNVW